MVLVKNVGGKVPNPAVPAVVTHHLQFLCVDVLQVRASRHAHFSEAVEVGIDVDGFHPQLYVHLCPLMVGLSVCVCVCVCACVCVYV